MADHADLAVVRRQRAQVCRGRIDVGHQPLVGHAATGAHDGGRIGRVGAGSLAGVEVGTDRVVAELGEPAHHLLGGPVVARQVVDDHNAPTGVLTLGAGEVRLDVGAV
nr:hypothetical protein [Tetrasphaera sp. HKS02]